MAYHGPGVKIHDQFSQMGLQSRTRNPKRKARIPYHGRRRTQHLQVMGGTKYCIHSIAHHETLPGPNGNPVTISYALPCTVKEHKAKTPVHRDSTGKKWS
jgi:hypothetical protein